METKKECGMLELISQPAFAVVDGVIVKTNRNVLPLLPNAVGLEVASLLGEDAQEYADFQSGCLCITLQLGFTGIPATVHRVDGFDVFTLEPDEDQAELRALVLASTQIRQPLSDLVTIVDRMDPEAQEVMRLKKRLFQINRLVNNMSDAFHYDNDSTANMVYVDVCDQMEEWFERLEALVSGCGLRLEFSRPHQSVCSLIDEEKLERAVNNMISNAVKASPAGGTIQARLTYKNNRLYLSVRDQGVGFSPDAIGSIHCRYQRQPGLDLDGLGLGMVLIRAAAAIHGGTLLITRPQDGGTQVTLSIAPKKPQGQQMRSPVFHFDYAGEWDHFLLELSEVLPDEFYK